MCTDRIYLNPFEIYFYISYNFTLTEHCSSPETVGSVLSEKSFLFVSKLKLFRTLQGLQISFRPFGFTLSLLLWATPSSSVFSAYYDCWNEKTSLFLGTGVDFHNLQIGPGFVGLTHTAQRWFGEGSCWYGVSVLHQRGLWLGKIQNKKKYQLEFNALHKYSQTLLFLLQDGNKIAVMRIFTAWMI